MKTRQIIIPFSVVLLSLSIPAITFAEKVSTPKAAIVSASAASRIEVAPSKVTPKTPVAATTGGVVSKGGENQYPTGQLPIPPKPKKDGPEEVGAAALS